MVNKERRHERLGLRYSKVFIFLASVACVAILLVLLAWQLFPSSSFRTTVLLVGSPMLVVSWDGQRKHVTVIEVPASTSISGITGVGEYSLESLWKLGEFDARDKGLLADSLGDTLAVAIPWYSGPKSGDLASQSAVEASIRKTFSMSNVVALLLGKYRSNISFQTFLLLAMTTQGLRTDAFERFNVASTSAVVGKELADGATAQFIDRDRLDVILGTRLEEEAVRAESLRVMVYNTTPTQTLGKRMERRVSRAGALVIGIGNDKPAVGRCVVSGSKAKLKSKTAIYFMQFFHCEARNGESFRSDLELRVGTDFEKLFLAPLFL